ncbi:MAG: hypothetical protein R2764_04110 [Bacteroidales bacterium]
MHFWGNTAGSGPSQISIWDTDSCHLNIYYSDVEDGLNGIEPGFQGDTVNLMNVDPEFITIGDYSYVLAIGSLCHNVGTQVLYLPPGYVIPLNCLCGNPRVLESEIDLGCFETISTSVGSDKPSDPEKYNDQYFSKPHQLKSNHGILFRKRVFLLCYLSWIFTEESYQRFIHQF